jgi:hypothetical protein
MTVKPAWPSALVAALLLWTCAGSAHAHGLLARVRVVGDDLVGFVYYSSGDAAGGEWVELYDRDAGRAKVGAVTADSTGMFRFDATAGHRYRIVVSGDEGHTIELEIGVAAGAQPVDEVAAPKREFAPAWQVLGVILIVLTLFALSHRWGARRRARTQLSATSSRTSSNSRS